MPPKKRALAETDSNVQSPPKRASTGEKNDKSKDKSAEDSTPELPDDHVMKRPPYEYICIDKMYWFKEDSDDDDDDDDDNDGGDEDEEGDEDSDAPRYRRKPKMLNKLPADHPDWQYTIMAESWRRLCTLLRKSQYCHPDLFHMYIYNDFHNYGLLELLENLLIDFNKAFNKKDLDQMWCVTATMAHWLNNHRDNTMWHHCDDGWRVAKTADVIGRMVLTMLETLERKGELKVSGRYRDLGLVIALFLESGFVSGITDMDLEGTFDPRKDIVAYAKLAGVDLKNVGIDGMGKRIKRWNGVKAIKKETTGDRWDWKAKFNALKDEYRIGGDNFNIVALSREERAKYAFDEKDPLADISDQILKKVVKGELDLV